MGSCEVERLGGWLEAARDRGFAGRAAELGLFRSALDGWSADGDWDGDGPRAFAVLYLHGPGGIGKTMLLRRYAAEARAAGRTVVELNGRVLEPTPCAFEEAAGAVLGDERAVLLVDTFERCQGLDGWLHDRFLPRLPAGALVVIAGREPPDPRWTADPGWTDLLRTVALRNLAPDESVSFLEARGVPKRTHAALMSFTGGHPLALALAAEVAVRDEKAAARWEPSRDVIETLLPQVLGEVPSPVHRQALEVCAHVYVTTEGLLRAVLGEAAVPMFAWLRGLPFVEATGSGLFPHDVVREALEADLRWRDPEGYEEMHVRLHQHLFERVREAPESRMLPAVGAFLYMYRTDGHMSEFHSWRGEGEVEEGPCTPDDHAAVLALADQAEGPRSADLARHWLDRQPESFRVYRSTRCGAAVAFSAWLRLNAPCDEDADEDTDPVVAAAWAHARATGPLRDGEHLALARFAVHPPVYQRMSPVMDLMQWRAMGEIFRAERLAWSFIVLRDGEFWGPHMEHLGLLPIADRPRVGEWTYTLFAHDWRAQPVLPWLALKTHLMLSGAPGPGERSRRDGRGGAGTGVGVGAGEGGPWHGGLVVLSRPEFDAAVRDALRALRRPGALAASPLTRSRLVVEHGLALRDVLLQGIEAVREGRSGEKRHRAVTATYLRGTPTQEAAAERLGLPFSTYRRHLTDGIERICDALWRRELHGAELE